MEKFKELVLLCKASVEISVNYHKDMYETVEKYINENYDKKYIDEEVFKEMIVRDTIVKVQVYPLTPVGCYVIYHYDIDIAINKALNAVKNDI